LKSEILPTYLDILHAHNMNQYIISFQRVTVIGITFWQLQYTAKKWRRKSWSKKAAQYRSYCDSQNVQISYNTRIYSFWNFLCLSTVPWVKLSFSAFHQVRRFLRFWTEIV